MQVSQIAYAQTVEPQAGIALLEQVAVLLRRVSAALGAESCGWLTDLFLEDGWKSEGRCPLTVTRIATDKILLALHGASTQLCMTKDEMAAVAAFQRAAWTPSLQQWPMTAWSKASAGHTPQTTICIPLHGPSGTTSIVFVPLGDHASHWYETALTFIGPLLEAERELRAVFIKRPSQQELLTAQEVESLKWASKGKTAWESSTIQGIPERTVVQRLKRAREKLGAGSTALAIGIATQRGLLREHFNDLKIDRNEIGIT